MPFLARILRYRVVVCSLRTFRFAFLLAILIGLAAIGGQATSAADAAPAPNSDPTYQALRNLGLSAEAVSVNNLDLKRDAGTFHLRSGTVCLSHP